MEHSLLLVDEVYKVQACHGISIYEVEHEGFEEFCRLLYRFQKRLGEDSNDELWGQYLSALYGYRNRLSMGLLPFNAYVKHEELERVERLTERSQYIFPQYYEDACQLTQLYQTLTGSKDTPLLERLLKAELLTDTLHIVLRSRSQSAQLLEFLRNRITREINLMTAPVARSGSDWKSIALAGPPKLYPKHLFTAPRAGRIHVVSYACLDNGLDIGLDFHNGITKEEGHVSGGEIVWEREEKRQSARQPKLEVNSWNLTPEEDHLLRRAASDSSSSPEWDKVNTRLYRLANDKAVLLEAGDNFSIDVLWMGNQEVEVCRVKHRDLQVGMYLLLRTGKDRNHLLDLSKKFLGDEAESCFSCQRTWKRELRNILDKHPIRRVVRHLREQGAKRAHPINLRNWAEDNTIGPRDLEDFRILLRMLKLEERLKDFRTASKKIQQARTRAGFAIRGNLCEIAMSADLTQLEIEGEYCFQLPDEAGGSMTAYRIESVSDHTAIIARQYARVVFDLD